MLLKILVICFLSRSSAYHLKYDKSNCDSRKLTLVKTAQGLIRGSFLSTYTGTRFYSFRRIRFAEPPIGQNRFKPPVPKKPWKDVYDATNDGPVCPQPHGEILGPISEDCLYLNVYTKNLKDKRPVIVFFHPGGFLLWTSRSTFMGPQYIMNKDIVLVTANYRLGALGFLCTGDSLLRGNYGMKDQVAVLRWVKQNIANFGGDPDNITIMGCSAGSASVQLHMLSPMSQGLFHKAIAMSGSATAGWAINRHPMFLAQQLTKFMGCGHTNTPKEVYDCVKSADAQFIANASDSIRVWKDPPVISFVSVVEKDYGDGEERFLTDEPIELMKQGAIYSVPLVIGTTLDEVAYLAYYMSDSRKQEFTDNFYKIAPWQFIYDREGPRSEMISDTFKAVYLHNQPISNATCKSFGELYSVVHMIFPQVQAARLLAEKSSQPVYMYLFSYVGRYSFWYQPGTKIPIGASHVDDLSYMMYISLVFPEYNATDPEVNIINTMTSTWTEFARTGIPILPDINTEWFPMLPGSPQYLEIGNDPDVPFAGVSLKMVPGVPFPEHIALFESLFPLSGPHQIFY